MTLQRMSIRGKEVPTNSAEIERPRNLMIPHYPRTV